MSLNVPYNFLFYQYGTTAKEELTFSIRKSSIQKNTYELDETILFCRHCKKFLAFQPVNIGAKFSENELTHAYVALNSNIDNSHWTCLFGGEWDETSITETNEQLLRTSSYDFLLSHGNERMAHWYELDRVRHRFELRLVMQTIVGNGSFRTAHWWDYYENRRSHSVDEIPIETRHVAPVFAISEAGKEDAFRFRIHPMKLKFVSCGTAGQTGLVFEQLSSIFDIYIWMGILLTTILMTMLCSYIRCFHHNKLETFNFKVFTITFLLEGGRDRSTLNEEVQDVHSNLNGNISIVFVVLAIGLLLGCSVFFGEARRVIGSKVLNSSQKLGALLAKPFVGLKIKLNGEVRHEHSVSP
ncbi:unnamed protein product [Orchesella dallaii]|uniref:Uncharacterized protein n=1 Tax=Orchesella dallaii TaxID=48710 RepID=A0ABP1PT66_9HEXA